MAKLVIQRFLGRLTNPNQLDAPKGALAAATNCALVRPGLLTPRNGLGLHSTDSTWKNTHRLWEYQGTKMKFSDDGAGATAVLRWTGATWSSVLASAQDVDSASYPLHEVETQDALFIAESVGLRRFESPTSSSGFAGMPAMPDMDRSNSTLTNDANGVLPSQNARAYRATIEYRSSDGTRNRISAPSGRLVLRNTTSGGGASNQIPVVRVLLPVAVNTTATALTAGNLWLSLYASSMATDLTSEPLADYGMVYDYLLSSSDVSTGYVDITDVTPDLLRGSSLYTNDDQDSLRFAAHPPPFIRCLAAYKGCLVGANTTTRQFFEFQVLAVAGSNGIQDTDTIQWTQGGSNFTITAKTTPGAASHYKLENTGSVSKDVELTAQNIVACINRHASNTFLYATYAGIPGDVRSLGKIIVWSRKVNDTAFTPHVGTGDKRICFEPQFPETSASSTVQSTEDDWPNGWVLSRRDQPDSWPQELVGEMGLGAVIHVGTLDDSVFFFHDSGEVWRGSGEPPMPGWPGTWRVERWRTNLTLLAPQTVKEMDGWLWALTDRGIVRMSADGYEVMSGPIAPDLTSQLLSSGATNVRQKAYAVVHPSERRYVLALLVSGVYRFHVYHAQAAEDGATGWTDYVAAASEEVLGDMRCAYWSNGDDALYYGETGNSSAKIYADSNGTGSNDWDDNTAAIAVAITTPPIVHEDGSVAKQLREVQAVFEGSQPSSITATIATEHDSQQVTVATQSTNICRIPVPQSVQRGARHTVTLNFTDTNQWKLASLALLYRPFRAERASK